jgi:hypothetical protein
MNRFRAVPKVYNFFKVGVTNIPKIFGNDFIEQRYYLHFILTALFVLLPLRFMYLYMDLGTTSNWFQALLGFGFGYLLNAVRESYLYEIGKAKFDWLDIQAGAWGGLVGAIIYIAL